MPHQLMELSIMCLSTKEMEIFTTLWVHIALERLLSVALDARTRDV